MKTSKNTTEAKHEEQNLTVLSASAASHLKKIKDLEERVDRTVKNANLLRDRINSLETSLKWKEDEYSVLKSLYDILKRPVFDTMRIVDEIRDYLMTQHGYNPKNPYTSRNQK